MFYIGVKIIEARPEDRDKLQGYSVKYPDGYVSWSPKNVFESAYLPMGENSNSITEEMVKNFIKTQEVNKLDQKTTLLSSKTITGFLQYETSSCVDPNNYDEEIGKKICIEKIYDKIWDYLGFVLQWGRYGLKNNE
jgi:hypothetical protein